MVDKILNDLNMYNEMLAEERMLEILSGISYRIKSIDSVKWKLERYKDTERDLRSVLNDLLGIRFIVEDYAAIGKYDFLRMVDLTAGKESDDGYRGIHLYFQKDNYHYQIEVQIWSAHDALFNIWAHTRLYKLGTGQIGRTIRQAYEKGLLKDEKDLDEAFYRQREGR